ncbi:hypothetical protein [Paractinoplanes durhamensis]|uniref:Uncharacterized protein n=1 Tax=Paractinoplanes durhamensis TaxID=113563 RepID=A0ABQ3YUP2_9ACTN|nr:hypothetical protein [Actinoplanes durhamensis]GIE01064.1 hypothetical protein Adu01nite_24140 [Actinoplanes durhamensis]
MRHPNGHRALAVAAVAALMLSACGRSEPETLPAPQVPAGQPSESAVASSASSGTSAAPGTSPTARTESTAKPTVKPTAGKTTKPAAKKAVLPSDLVGAWRTVTASGSAFSYEFTADGKYLYNGIMQDGDLRYTLQEGGRASVAGDSITFKPQQTVMTRTENGVSTTSKPQRSAREAVFAVDGNSLTFTEADGSGSVYERG